MPPKSRAKLTARKNEQSDYHKKRAASRKDRAEEGDGCSTGGQEQSTSSHDQDQETESSFPGRSTGQSSMQTVEEKKTSPKRSSRLASKRQKREEESSRRVATTEAIEQAVPVSIEEEVSPTIDEPIADDVISIDMPLASPHVVPRFKHKDVQATVEMQDAQTSTEKQDTQTTTEPMLINHPSFLQEAYRKLTFLLPEAWSVVLQGLTHLNIVKLASGPNPKVDIAVTFCKEKGIEIYVNNQSLLNNHYLWILTKLPDDCDINCLCETLCNLVAKCDGYRVCEGSADPRCKDVCHSGVFSDRVIVYQSSVGKTVYKSKHCHLLSYKTVCEFCRREENNMIRKSKRIKREEGKRNLFGINTKYYTKEELLDTLKQSRASDKKHKRQVKDLQERITRLIAKEGHNISKRWSDEFKNINQANFDKMSDIQKLFWDQQMKAASLRNKASMKWHPMCIRMALQFHSRSPSAYKTMQGVGILTLPSERTLYDFTHAINAEEGCQKEILDDLKGRFDAKCKKDHEKFVTLMFDEMTIESKLVYQKSSGRFIGYVNLNEVEKEFEKLQACWTGVSVKREAAKKILVFMIKNITASSKSSVVKGVVAVYSTSVMTAAGLHTRVWEVITQLEAKGIPVLVVTCDGASTNRRFIKMHPGNICRNGKDMYSTINMASPDFRLLFFILDPPHLLKTIRNCFANSGAHKKTRKLWKNGENISWTLVEGYWEKHRLNKFRMAPRVKKAHVKLTSWSAMRVSYAAQVMSKSLVTAIKKDVEIAEEAGKKHPDYKEAVKFMELVNDFFDCVNGHNPTSGNRFKNDNLKPYSSKDDPRFETLLNFVKYFDEWEREVMCRRGKFSRKQRKAMVISDQTTQGINITVNSFIDAASFLISKGAETVCGRRFCQDALEQHFSLLRLKGGCNNNPTLAQALRTRISLHAQGQVALPSSRGNTEFVKEDLEIDDTQLMRRRKKNE